MTWKPDVDPLTETARPRLWLSAQTVHQVRELGQQHGLSDDAVVKALLVMRRGLLVIAKQKRSRTKLERIMKELLSALGETNSTGRNAHPTD